MWSSRDGQPGHARRGRQGAAAARRACTSAGRRSRGGLVEHAVDVLVAVGAAEDLGQFDRLVDGDAVGNVHAVRQLVGADQQHAMFHRRQLRGLAVDMAREHGVERGGLGDAAVQQGVEVGAVALGEAVLLAHVGVDDGGVAARQQPFVQALQRELARAPARRLGGRARLARGPAGRDGALTAGLPAGWPSPPPRGRRRGPCRRRAPRPGLRCRPSGWRWRPAAGGPATRG